MGNGLCVETSSSWTVFDWLDKVVGNLGSYSGAGKSRRDDDAVDRLSHHYTTFMLVIFAIIISTKQYAGDSIQCWCPAQFTDAHVAYTNQLCWVSNTYYIPMNHVIPLNNAPKQEATLTYYQWVPIILLCMALFFKLPRMIWKIMASQTSLNLDRLVTMVHQLQWVKKGEREELLKEMTEFLDDWIVIGQRRKVACLTRTKRQVAKYSCFVCGRKHGNYFVTAIMITKLLYFANAFAQLFILNAFLGTDFSAWGFQVMSALANGDSDFLEKSHRFPRVTLCDFQIRQMNNVHQWTVQCVLPNNLFNSRIFLFFWFWLVFLVVCSSLSLLTHIYGTWFPENRFRYIKKYLKIRGEYVHKSKFDRKLIKRFAMDHLRSDGVFVLQIMARNGTDILTSQIIEQLFQRYKQKGTVDKERNGTDVESM